MTIGMEVMQKSNGTPNTMNIMAQSKTIAWRVIWKYEKIYWNVWSEDFSHPLSYLSE